MHPPRISTLLLHHNGFRTAILSCHAYNATRSSTRLLFSTTTGPSLIQTTNIPAPHAGHIRVLSLNSPHNRNAISRQLLSELSSSINAVKAQVEDEAAKGEVVGHGTRVLVLASEVDECFCAGADLKERRGMSKEEYAV
jgi:methylglutaconyl-CoA hydratase